MTRSTEQYKKQLVETIVEGMQEVKAHEIVVLDMRNIKHAITDYLVVCHGDSTTQVDAIYRSVDKGTQESLKEKPLHAEGMQNSQWILMDYVDVIVHVFHKDARPFYDIEGLWADAKTTKIIYQD